MANKNTQQSINPKKRQKLTQKERRKNNRKLKNVIITGEMKDVELEEFEN